MKPKTSEYQLAICGMSGVGKSCMTIRFVSNEFDETEFFNPTIEDSYTTDVVVDDLKSVITILDTAGADDYDALRQEYMRDSDGFILVFDVTDSRNSLAKLSQFVQDIRRNRESEEFPLIICGNKVDLSENSSYQEASQRLAEQLKCELFETSAKNGTNIQEAFTAIIRLVRKERQLNKLKATNKNDTRKGLFASVSKGNDQRKDLDAIRNIL